MDFKHLYDMVRDLAKRGFYGTLQIEFKNGKPTLGTRIEKVLFDRPMIQSLKPNSMKLDEVNKQEA